MTVIIGVVILVAAVLAAAVGFIANNGSAQTLPPDSFAVFGYHVSGTTGALLLHGVVLGALGMLGLAMILAGARRSSRRGRVARQELKRSERRVAAYDNNGGDDRAPRDPDTATDTSDPPHRAGLPRSWRHPLASR
ncbi:hypothetical protein AB4Z55_17365 [Gordonia sp. ABKF26]|uniref:hypothetical protein n=1 Tax=Gordonia sp. ABKF26 TaxID=3238687 RepID=UPI0034E51BE8